MDRHKHVTRPQPDAPAPEASEAERVSRHDDETSLGYVEDAGHPGGEPDLEHKSDTEE
jgi:hypothetical protein